MSKYKPRILSPQDLHPKQKLRSVNQKFSTEQLQFVTFCQQYRLPKEYAQTVLRKIQSAKRKQIHEQSVKSQQLIRQAIKDIKSESTLPQLIYDRFYDRKKYMNLIKKLLIVSKKGRQKYLITNSPRRAVNLEEIIQILQPIRTLSLQIIELIMMWLLFIRKQNQLEVITKHDQLTDQILSSLNYDTQILESTPLSEVIQFGNEPDPVFWYATYKYQKYKQQFTHQPSISTSVKSFLDIDLPTWRRIQIANKFLRQGKITLKNYQKSIIKEHSHTISNQITHQTHKYNTNKNFNQLSQKQLRKKSTKLPLIHSNNKKKQFQTQEADNMQMPKSRSKYFFNQLQQKGFQIPGISDALLQDVQKQYLKQIQDQQQQRNYDQKYGQAMKSNSHYISQDQQQKVHYLSLKANDKYSNNFSKNNISKKAKKRVARSLQQPKIKFSQLYQIAQMDAKNDLSIQGHKRISQKIACIQNKPYKAVQYKITNDRADSSKDQMQKNFGQRFGYSKIQNRKCTNQQCKNKKQKNTEQKEKSSNNTYIYQVHNKNYANSFLERYSKVYNSKNQDKIKQKRDKVLKITTEPIQGNKNEKHIIKQLYSIISNANSKQITFISSSLQKRKKELQMIQEPISINPNSILETEQNNINNSVQYNHKRIRQINKIQWMDKKIKKLSDKIEHRSISINQSRSIIQKVKRGQRVEQLTPIKPNRILKPIIRSSKLIEKSQQTEQLMSKTQQQPKIKKEVIFLQKQNQVVDGHSNQTKIQLKTIKIQQNFTLQQKKEPIQLQKLIKFQQKNQIIQEKEQKTQDKFVVMKNLVDQPKSNETQKNKQNAEQIKGNKQILNQKQNELNKRQSFQEKQYQRVQNSGHQFKQSLLKLSQPSYTEIGLIDFIETYIPHSKLKINRLYNEEIFAMRQIYLIVCYYNFKVSAIMLLHQKFVQAERRISIVFFTIVNQMLQSFETQIFNHFLDYIFSNDPIDQIVVMQNKYYSSESLRQSIKKCRFYIKQRKVKFEIQGFNNFCLFLKRNQMKQDKGLVMQNQLIFIKKLRQNTAEQTSSYVSRDIVITEYLKKNLAISFEKRQKQVPSFVDINQMNEFFQDNYLALVTKQDLCIQKQEQTEFSVIKTLEYQTWGNYRYIYSKGIFYFLASRNGIKSQTVSMPTSTQQKFQQNQWIPLFARVNELKILFLKSTTAQHHYIFADWQKPQKIQLTLSDSQDLIRTLAATIQGKKISQLFAYKNNQQSNSIVVSVPSFKFHKVTPLENGQQNRTYASIKIALQYPSYLKGVRQLQPQKIQQQFGRYFAIAVVKMNNQQKLRSILVAKVSSIDIT